MTLHILLVDDEEIVRRASRRILAQAADLPGGKPQLAEAQSGAEALRAVEAQAFDLVLLDVVMPQMDGLAVLQQLKERHPDLVVLMVTGLAQVQTAVQAMKLGAFDYLPKPFDPDTLLAYVRRALAARPPRAGAVPAGAALGPGASASDEDEASAAPLQLEAMVGRAPAMQALYRLIAKAAPTPTTVLITGESGTGKEMVARAVHHNSLRRDHPFVTVDCTTLAENLLESELFGHVKGAFTGAVASKRGLFELADQGTLFLDEFGNIPLALQAKLLRVIQQREFRPVGSTQVHSTHARLIVATNMDLAAMVAEGRFREDLYYRVAVFPIHVPALRERAEDIPVLARHFLDQACAELGRPHAEISEAAMSLLQQHRWPGNVRELENVMQRAAILASDAVIRRAHLLGLDAADASSGANGIDVPRTSEDLKQAKKLARERSVEELERQFVLEALRRHDWNVTRSAEDTGMLRSNFQALMKKHGIRVRDVLGGEDATEDADD